MEHITKIRVRLSETDALGIVYYSNYLVYFDVARLELLRELEITTKAMEERGLMFLCSEVSCKYLSPLKVDEMVTVKTWIERIGRSSVVYGHVLINEEDREAARGHVRDVLTDKSRKPVEIPNDWRLALSKYLK